MVYIIPSKLIAGFRFEALGHTNKHAQNDIATKIAPLIPSVTRTRMLAAVFKRRTKKRNLLRILWSCAVEIFNAMIQSTITHNLFERNGSPCGRNLDATDEITRGSHFIDRVYKSI